MLLNPDAQVRVETAEGGIPVLIVDEFYLDPDDVRAEGLRANFDKSLALYPGRHADIADPALEAVKVHLCRLIRAIGGPDIQPNTVQSDFSILTTRARDLLATQKHPHIDPVAITAIVYLNPSSTAGTCLYYNEALQTHAIRAEDDTLRLAEFMAREGARRAPLGYQVPDDGCWRKLYTIEGRFNRFAAYPGNVFHSIDIDDVPDQFDISTARMTQRFFFNQRSQPTADPPSRMSERALPDR